MSSWPKVFSEDVTLDLVASGHSIARYGDGEFKLCLGRGIKSQVFDVCLSKRLREILHSSGDCLVGIPNLNVDTKPFWDEFRRPAYTSLFAKHRMYVSAFISRPDSAPWIHRPEYFAKVESLWRGRRVVLVRGSGKSLTPSVLASAKEVVEVVCDPQHAWRQVEQLVDQVCKTGIERVLLCCGPTATVMAVDLCARGRHAIDLGHIGMWVKRQHLSPLVALEEGRRDAS